jgi:hypothetical protein
MPPKRSSIRGLAVAVLLGISLVVLASTGGSAVAVAATRCAAPPYPGAGVFTGKIQVTNVTCSYGKTFVVKYYNCRTKSGSKPAGRCTKLVQGFSCVETRTSGPTQIVGRVTCRNGTKRIVHSYVQTVG